MSSLAEPARVPASGLPPRTGPLACPADDVALLRIEGGDAESFLQGQLSSDVKSLRPGDLQWSSYNSPKGRVLASLVLWRQGATAFRAVLAADLATPIARRLRMYVLRAKVTITEDGAPPRGVAGAGALDAVNAALGLALAPAQGAIAGEALALALDRHRVLVAGAAPGAAALGDGTPDTWRLARIAAGVPLVTQATSDAFVPQALNLDALGGISFRKGCYPGQEIVARTHYLGRLKERLYAFRLDAAAPAAGARLFAASFGDQACGTVVNAAACPDGGSALLAVVQRSAGEGDAVHLERPDGPTLAPVGLPYALPEPAPQAPRG